MGSEQTERRLSAILSADIVGYSRLMAQDQDATVDTLAAHRERIRGVIAQHRGRLVDFTGDNFLAEFPTALESLRCAIEIQRSLAAVNEYVPEHRRMDFRIGAHLGDVRAEGERIFGDGVNIAARLESLAEPGGICVSAIVREQVRNKLEAGWLDLGARELKNIPEPVQVWKLVLGGTADAPVQRRSRIPRRALVALAILALLGIGLWAARTWGPGLALDMAGLMPQAEPPLPDRPSIVVLPFANLSGDPQQEYFSDGITEDLTTDLSHLPGLFVIASNSAFTYKGQRVHVEQVGREMGVRYVLQGSVRREGEQLRITTQLSDATTGFQLWSQRYDRPIDDLFALQSEISREVVDALPMQIRVSELARVQRKKTRQVSAYDAYMLGLSQFLLFTRDGHARARRYFQEAVDLDPSYVDGWATLGITYLHQYSFGWDRDPANLRRAEELVRKAEALDPRNFQALILRTQLLMQAERYDDVALAAEKALAINPGDPVARFFLGVARIASDRPLTALEPMQHALRQNPRPPAAWWTTLGVARFATGDEDEAIRIWEKARAMNSDLIPVRAMLAWRYQLSGRSEQARELVREILAVNPDLTLEDTAALVRFDAEGTGLAALRAAGLPEAAP